jgi:predicted acyltransferase
VIFAVGLALNLVPLFDWAHVRIPGVLQRIALCSLLAAPIVLAVQLARRAGLAARAVCALCVLMLAVPVPDAQGVVAAGVLEPGRDFGAWLDRQLLAGHLWASGPHLGPGRPGQHAARHRHLLFGVLTGRWLDTCHGRRPSRLCGCCWPDWRCWGWARCSTACSCPSTRTCGRRRTPCSWPAGPAGLRRLLLAAGRRTAGTGCASCSAWLFQPLVIYGMNALFIFALSGFVARCWSSSRSTAAARSLKQALYAPLQALPLAPQDASLLWALLFNAVMFLLAWWMWTKRWFIKA